MSLLTTASVFLLKSVPKKVFYTWIYRFFDGHSDVDGDDDDDGVNVDVQYYQTCEMFFATKFKY